MVSEDFLRIDPFSNSTSEPFSERNYMAEGWKYKDFALMPEVEWDMLLAQLGENNYRLLTQMTRPMPDGQVRKRGQMIVSPEGMKILIARMN